MVREGVTHVITSPERAAEFHAVDSFAVRADTALSRRVGMPVQTLIR
jgi:hypothetical protein